MALKNLDLMLHYEFNENLEDSSSNNFHLTSNTPSRCRYNRLNANGVRKSTLMDEDSSAGHHLTAIGSEAVSYSMADFDSGKSLLFSFWARGTVNIFERSVVIAGGVILKMGCNAPGGCKLYKLSIDGNSDILDLLSADSSHLDGWDNYIFSLKKEGEKTRIIVSINSSITKNLLVETPSFNQTAFQILDMRSGVTIDEIRVYKGVLDIGHSLSFNIADGDLREIYNLSVDSLDPPEIAFVQNGLDGFVEMSLIGREEF